jgi:hypothetical protein
MDINWELRDARLHNRISDLSDMGVSFVVGITASPEDRIDTLEQGGEDYDEMTVLYQTRSKSEIRRLKQELTEHYDGYADPTGRGATQGPPFYVYICRYAEA